MSKLNNRTGSKKGAAPRGVKHASATVVRESAKGTQWELRGDKEKHVAFTSASSKKIMDKATVRYVRVLKNLADM